jgi:hypothetical protein
MVEQCIGILQRNANTAQEIVQKCSILWEVARPITDAYTRCIDGIISRNFKTRDICMVLAKRTYNCDSSDELPVKLQWKHTEKLNRIIQHTSTKEHLASCQSRCTGVLQQILMQPSVQKAHNCRGPPEAMVHCNKTSCSLTCRKYTITKDHLISQLKQHDGQVEGRK